MNINDLISIIQSSACKSINVDHLSSITGNTDGSGNYKIIKLTIGNQVIEFHNSNGAWAVKNSDNQK
jgi:hypothetical protein